MEYKEVFRHWLSTNDDQEDDLLKDLRFKKATRQDNKYLVTERIIMSQKFFEKKEHMQTFLNIADRFVDAIEGEPNKVYEFTPWLHKAADQAEEKAEGIEKLEIANICHMCLDFGSSVQP